MITSTGRWLDIDREFVADIREVAHSLALTNRYGGHSRKPVTVASHSVLVSRLVPQRGTLPYQALMHDAHEAYFGDVTRPVKELVGEPVRIAEAMLSRMLRRTFGLPEVLDPLVKAADDYALALEVRWYMPRGAAADRVLSCLDTRALERRLELYSRIDVADVLPPSMVDVAPREPVAWLQAEIDFIHRYIELRAA